MAEESFQEKTEEATPKKREEARKEGQVAKSMEIGAVFILLAGISVLYFFGFMVYRNILAVMRSGFAFDAVPDVNHAWCVNLMFDLTSMFLVTVLPVFAAAFLTALAANLFQVGFVISSKAIAPKLSKISIIKGFTRIFSVRSLVELAKSIAKLSIIGLVAFLAIKGQIGEVINLPDATPAYVVLFMLRGAFRISMWVLLFMIAVAFLDYAFQKWKFEKDLMMTKEEVKEEFKQAEGDPHVKSKIRSIQQQAARKRMMQEVPSADVVVTNPTHLALAIRYEALSMTAPKVVAKGAGKVAEKIKEIATEHKVPVIENKELARNLYKLVDVGGEIPSEFYQAVAELLAYVYKLKGKTI